MARLGGWVRRRRSKNRKGRGERGREGERERLLTIKKTLKVDKHNALSENTEREEFIDNQQVTASGMC